MVCLSHVTCRQLYHAVGAKFVLQAHGFTVEGKRHVTGIVRNDAAALLRFQRRMSPACVELTYMFDGDHNGAVHYLGSKYGQQDFVNPALSGQVKVWPYPLSFHMSTQLMLSHSNL